MFGFANRLRWTLKTDKFSWTRIVEAMRQLSPLFQGRGSDSRSVTVPNVLDLHPAASLPLKLVMDRISLYKQAAPYLSCLMVGTYVGWC
jgi:hypothetical protein